MTVASWLGSQLSRPRLHGSQTGRGHGTSSASQLERPGRGPAHLSCWRMEEGEKSPLLVQDPGCQEGPLTSSLPGPAPQEERVWRAGPGGGPASSLPLGISCLKCLTFLLNFLFSLLGLLALAIGLWGLAVKGSLGSVWGAALPKDPILGLVLGGLAVSAVSLAGCLGALCESAFLLRCFSGGLVAFLLLEAVVGALLVALWGPLQDGLEHTLRAAITHYQDDPGLRFLIDQIQLGLQCCGASSYRDWTRNLYFNCSSPGVQACSLPASCCVHPGEDGVSVNDQCGSGALRLDEDAARRVVHLEGCGPPLRRWLRRNVRAAGAYAIVVVAVQGVELLLANQLARALAVRPGEVDSPRAAGTVALSTRASHSVKRPLPNWPRADSPGGPPGKVSYGIPDALASSTGCASGPPGPPFP
ncbi:tetraspanin-10 [Panthera leo]|uniref:tetraspanin-10 n=1 Tax=Panthera leo TaxID=9689 RepID=UPI001C6A19AA|nr:tetraspanin-10 [Panthera leo]XP_042772895.1 tetraspanin-10 [Panthera leo]XP_042772896.1 tetraspanin-10 [Panthera leo]XP_042772897.1 tetraspanin-10 [Panthera leo]